MYGGVSLAIYINGVAQEFLHLVRATAADPKDRNLAAFVGRPAHRYRAGLPASRAAAGPRTRWCETGGDGRRSDSRAIRRRHPLGNLRWRHQRDVPREGAFANDQSNGATGSSRGSRRVRSSGRSTTASSAETLDGLPEEDPPKSLLSSHRMYRKLLDAFDQMDCCRPETWATGPPWSTSSTCSSPRRTSAGRRSTCVWPTAWSRSSAIGTCSAFATATRGRCCCRYPCRTARVKCSFEIVSAAFTEFAEKR